MSDSLRSGKQVGTLLGGTGVAFLIGYVAKLVLLRLYGPEAFGVLEFVVASTAILIPVASLRYEDALMLPENDEEAWPVLSLAALLTLSFVAVIVLGAWILLLVAPEMVPVSPQWVWAIPVLVLVLRASKLAELWSARKARFGRIAQAGVVQASATTLVRISLFKTGAFGLVSGYVLGQLSGLSLYVRDLLKDKLPPSSIQRMSAAARRYVRFPLYSAPATLVGALTTRLPALAVISFFDLTVLGLFGQAFAILYVPLNLAAGAIGQVFFVDAARATSADHLAEITSEAHRRLVKLTLVPVAIAAAAGPDLFPTLFGADWAAAGEYARALAPWIALTAIASPLTRVFDVKERQRLDLWIGVIMLLGLVFTLWMAGNAGDALIAMQVLGIGGAVLRAGQIVVLLRLAGARLSTASRHYLVHAGLGLVAGAALFAASWAASPLVVTLVAIALVAGYAVWVIKSESLWPTYNP